jgi:kinesin family protein C1
MTGYANQEQKEQQGIIPRSMTDILKQSRAMLNSGWVEVDVSVAVVELYNEELRDLLDGEVLGNSIMQTHKKFKINRVNSRVVVSGLTAVPIDTSDLEVGMRQFEALLAQSSAARTTASTGMNEASSRSHLIVMIEIQGKHSDGVTLMQGGLRLCDLAGSERLDRTGNLNDANRLREAVNINKSLSCLSDVFLALNSHAAYVPHRNSKLTMLLQVLSKYLIWITPFTA